MIKKILTGTAISLLSLSVTADTLNSGDTAWILTSTALVLLMTLPGLSLFYAGLGTTSTKRSPDGSHDTFL